MYEIEKKFLVPRSFLTRLLAKCEIRFIHEITQFYLAGDDNTEHRIRKVEGQFGTSWIETKKSKGLGVRTEHEQSIEESEAWKLITAESDFFNSDKGAVAILKKKRYEFTKLQGVVLDEFDNVLNGSLLVEVELVSEDENADPMINQPDWFKLLIFRFGLDVTQDERLYGRNLATEII